MAHLGRLFAVGCPTGRVNGGAAATWGATCHADRPFEQRPRRPARAAAKASAAKTKPDKAKPADSFDDNTKDPGKLLRLFHALALMSSGYGISVPDLAERLQVNSRPHLPRHQNI